MAVLTYSVSVSPQNYSAALKVMLSGNYLTKGVIHPEVGVLSSSANSSLHAPFNGGTYGPAKGGSATVSATQFLWGGLASV